MTLEQEPSGRRDIEQVARELGGGWRIENGVMPVVVLTLPEAVAVLADHEQAVRELREALTKAAALLPPERPEYGGNPEWLARDEAFINSAGRVGKRL